MRAGSFGRAGGGWGFGFHRDPGGGPPGPASSPWMRLAVVLAVTAVVGSAAAIAYASEFRSFLFQTQPGVAVRTATATQGPIVTGVSYTGDVKAVNQLSVIPKTSGRLDKLFVDVGSKVKAGDVLAQIDATTLQAQVAQARANLAAAQAKYDSMVAGPRSEQVAQAEANVDIARQKLASMEAGGRPEQIAQAQANLSSAQERLGALQDGGRNEQVAQAEAGLRSAWAKKDQVEKGPTDADMQAAVTAADSARANLERAQATLETLKLGATQADWAAATAAVDTARTTMVAAASSLADVKAGPKPADIAAAESAVAQAKSAVARANDMKDLMDEPIAIRAAAGVTSSGAADQVAAAAQSQLDAAQAALTQLRNRPFQFEIDAAQRGYDTAKASYDAAVAKTEQMKRGATPQDLAQGEAGVMAAQAALASANANLYQLRLGPTAENVALVEAGVTQANSALEMTVQPATDRDMAQAANAVMAAQAQYQLAASPYTQWDIAQARDAVTVAEQQFNLAANPFTQYDLEASKAGVDQAKAALDITLATLSDNTIVSPFDGVVSQKLVSVGTQVGPTTPILTLISSDVEVTVGVEESQIGQISVGQRAEITVAAYPGTVFAAKVAVIAPAADPQSRTFQVTVRPDQQDGRLRPGMFAQVRIITQDKASGVLVPKEAVFSRNGQNSVFVVQGDVARLRAVTVGATTDAGQTEIVSGVQTGEEVVISGQGDLKDGDAVRRTQ